MIIIMITIYNLVGELLVLDHKLQIGLLIMVIKCSVLTVIFDVQTRNVSGKQTWINHWEVHFFLPLFTFCIYLTSHNLFLLPASHELVRWPSPLFHRGNATFQSQILDEWFHRASTYFCMHVPCLSSNTAESWLLSRMRHGNPCHWALTPTSRSPLRISLIFNLCSPGAFILMSPASMPTPHYRVHQQGFLYSPALLRQPRGTVSICLTSNFLGS